MTTPSERHIDAAISIVDTDEFKGLMAVDRVGKCVELVAAAMAEGEARETANLIGVIAGIRQKSGVGAKPMLGDLADAIAERVATAEREGMKRAAEIARNSGPATQDITSTMICDALDHAADLILAEAGEGE